MDQSKEESKKPKIIEIFYLIITSLSIINAISTIDFNFAFSLYGYLNHINNTTQNKLIY